MKENDFADLIESKKIKPNTVRIIRHSGKKFENLDNKIYWYYKNDPKKYHNITREQAENAFGDQKYLAVFVSTNLGETLFTNFYEIGKQEKRGDGETTYELSELDIFKEFEGKLKIDWKSDRNWNQIAGNTPKRILSTGRLTSLDELVPGKEYVRKDLHKAFGGNQQKGIVTLPNHNAIFLLNSLKGINYGYENPSKILFYNK